MKDKLLLVLGGPTASGKTQLAIRLAQWLGTGIINADSRQLYREMVIGTAVPSREELDQAPHYLVRAISIQDEMSVVQYETQALAEAERVFERNNVCIVTGGSGLYLKALYEGFDPLPPPDPKLRKKLNEELETQGLAALARKLQSLDAQKARETDLNNPRRVIRALEICLTPQSQPGAKPERPFRSLKLFLNPERSVLYSRINRRVDTMMEAGLEAEARELYPFRHLKALQTVGYRELFDYFDGKYNLDTAVELIKQHTRNYAKRQLTWFRNQDDFVPVSNFEEAKRLTEEALSQTEG